MMKIFFDKKHKRRRHILDYFRQAKDGVITGSADNDPAGVVTYTQVGAATKFSQLWLMLLSLPMLTVVEEMSARVGVVTKKGLNAVISRHYGWRLAMIVAVIVAICNIATIGADIAGMAGVVGLLTGINYLYFIIPIGLILGYLLIKESYAKMSRFLLILTPLFLLYVGAGFLTRPDWGEVFRSTLIPSWNGSLDYLILAVGLFGTTISPYLIFWQTTEEVEEHKTVKELRNEGGGVFAGMAYSHFIFYFIIIAAGATMFGVVDKIETAGQAALALKPIAGNLSSLLFSIGILISGTLAIPVLAASTAYTAADAMHWKEGLDKKLLQARGFYAVIILSLIAGVLIALFGINPMRMLVYTQVLNGILMPILLVILLKVTNNSAIMNQHTNRFWTNLFGILAVVVMVVLDLMLFWQWIK